MKRLITSLLLLITMAATGFSHNTRKDTTATRDDFKAFCAANVGWWTGEVASVIGETSVVGKKENTSTYYWKGSISEDGNAMSFAGVGPKHSDRALCYFDAAAKKIRITSVSSKGVVNQQTIHRDGKDWIRHTLQTSSDGTSREFHSVITLSNKGKTITIVIHVKNKDGKVNKQANVWHRVGK